MSSTPLAIFVYDRPEHLRLLLKGLERCKRIEECTICFFCDGARDETRKACVEAARHVTHAWAGRFGAQVVERNENFGLARSIVTGVSDLVGRHGRVIVLEDDLIPHPDFIDYMLQALDLYETAPEVYQISGYMFPIEHPGESVGFFLPLATTLAWGTWERAWSDFRWDPIDARESLADPLLRRRFDLDDSYPYSAMMLDRLDGRNQSWGILWWWAVFNAGGLVLHPRRSFVWVGGFDGTGTHCGKTVLYDQGNPQELLSKPMDRPFQFPRQIAADEKAFDRLKRYHRGLRNRGVRAKLKNLRGWLPAYARDFTRRMLIRKA